jgi:hypothetical protein
MGALSFVLVRRHHELSHLHPRPTLIPAVHFRAERRRSALILPERPSAPEMAADGPVPSLQFVSFGA